MAESVDALVSNTNDSNVVPVRPRLWVLRKRKSLGIYRGAFIVLGGYQRDSAVCNKKAGCCLCSTPLPFILSDSAGWITDDSTHRKTARRSPTGFLIAQ